MLKKCLLVCCCLAGIVCADVAAPKFDAAKPVWPENREKEWNLQVGFTAEFDGADAANAVLRFTGATMCRVFLNGEFCAYGPARGPHGFVRVDEWPLGARVKPGKNVLAIEVAGYNCNSFYTIRQPSFLQAEVIANGRILAATGTDGGTAFAARVLPYRVQKVQRFSYQRAFSEAYEHGTKAHDWRLNKGAEPPAKLAVQKQLPLLPRIVALPKFSIRPVTAVVSRGVSRYDEKAAVHGDRGLVCVNGENCDGYKQQELAWNPRFEVLRTATVSRKAIGAKPAWPLTLRDNEFAIFDFGVNDAGFPGLSIRCEQPATVYFAFDEILSKDDINISRYGCCAVVAWRLTEPGAYRLDAFEPYNFRYGKIIVRGGSCQVDDLYLREYVNPETERATFTCSDPQLNRIFEAARQTFIENAVDGFMDCPTRERAGWNCDAFFTSRVSMDLTGNDKEERIFLQNFLLPPAFPGVADGMLPMCYPSDFPDGNFIPNWAMWFVIELEEFYARTGDRAFVDAFRPRILKLVDFLKRYKNSDGLLEKLPRWVFVEWSRSNRLVQDVNYPSNMTWAKTLDAVAHLYALPELAAEAEQVRETIRKQAWNGTFFVDRALRQPDGSLKVDTESTETCQYYAFFFGTATPERYPELWARMRDDFGPKRKQTKKWEKVSFSNAFIGNYLRLEILSAAGLSAQTLDETKGYFYGMAEKTGTLWENDTTVASCCHGFASHVVRVLYRDVLGVRKIDAVNRQVELSFADVPLTSCAATIPVGDQLLTLSWERKGDELRLRVKAPDGYKVTASAAKGLRVVPVQ